MISNDEKPFIINPLHHSSSVRVFLSFKVPDILAVYILRVYNAHSSCESPVAARELWKAAPR